MCGRFTSTTEPAALATYFGAADVVADDLGRRYNVAPTDEVYAVAESKDGEERRLGSFRWGLVPFWSKDPSAGSRMINARSETILTSRAFKRSFTNRRCIVPADGFYEWEPLPGSRRKQPWYLTRTDGDVFAFAGLWDSWRPERRSREARGDERMVSCTIITTDANEVVRPIHDRMPVVLPPSAWDVWLDPANDDVDDLARLLVPAPDELVVATPVRPLVSNVRNDGPELIEPLPDEDRVTLF